MNRFTKTAVIEQLYARADGYQTSAGFDRNNGASQLLPKGADANTKALIDRAIQYGAMCALDGAASDIKSGHLGVSAKSSS